MLNLATRRVYNELETTSLNDDVSNTEPELCVNLYTLSTRISTRRMTLKEVPIDISSKPNTPFHTHDFVPSVLLSATAYPSKSIFPRPYLSCRGFTRDRTVHSTEKAASKRWFDRGWRKFLSSKSIQ